jgi:hypothetical protein
MAIHATAQQLKHIARHIDSHGQRWSQLICRLKQRRMLQLPKIQVCAGCVVLIPAVSHLIATCNPAAPR